MNIRLPTYFLPRSEQEAAQSVVRGRLPQRLIDVFHLRATPHALPQLVVVIGSLLGSELIVVSEDEISELPMDVRAQLQAYQVTQRNQFRVITVRELFILTVEAVEQHTRVAGYNDAVHLFGSLQAQIECDPSGIRITPFHHEGRLHVGRLDLLSAWQAGLAHLFHNPAHANESMHHLFLPAAPPQEVATGKGVVLAYPLLNSEVTARWDNQSFVLRIAYDLLIRLQQEMNETKHGNSFAWAKVPVPNRQRVEQELRLDHYEIQGDWAIKREPSQLGEPDSGQNSQQSGLKWLARLRQLAEDWSAPRIELPLQASADHYGEIIVQLMPNITRREDLAMMQAVKHLVAAPTSTLAQPVSIAQAPLPILTHSPATHSPVAHPKSVPRANRRKANDRASWKNDFAGSPIPARQSSTHKWWNDFEESAPTKPNQPSNQPSNRLLTTNDDDWDEPQATTEAVSAVDTKDANVQSPASDWAEDFK